VNEKTKAGKETGKQEDEHEDQKNLVLLFSSIIIIIIIRCSVLENGQVESFRTASPRSHKGAG